MIQFLALLALLFPQLVSADDKVSDVVLAIHAGTSDRLEIPPELEKSVHEGLAQALKAGYAVLAKKGSSLDAVEAAVKSLEDNPLFNAGKGAVFTREGKNELDASIMEGKNLMAGAVAGVTTIKNPISAARAVMEKTKHVLLVADGAEAFAKKIGLPLVRPEYFYTERRWKELQEVLKKQKLQSTNLKPISLGTTGAVALDANGNLAAATSTGGLTGKMHGRIGDSPIIGAGTYADNEACAVSCTGVGEYFIRFGVAHEICALVRLKGKKISEAATDLIHGKLKKADAEGGVIALDPKGNLALSYNSESLPRGYVTKDGVVTTLLYEKK